MNQFILGLKDVNIKHSDEINGCWEIVLQSKLSFAICPTCKTPSSSVKDYREHRLIHKPTESIPVELFIIKRRFRCLNPACQTKTFTEEIEGLKKKHVYTDAFEEFIANMNKHMDIPTIKNRLLDNYKLDIPQSTIHHKLKNIPTESNLVPYPIKTKYIGLDEFSFIKRNFGVILSDLEKYKTIDMVAGGKTTNTAKAVLKHIVPEFVEGACIDMWEPFKIACLETLHNAKIVADKFHVIKLINRAIDDVRIRISQQLSEEQASYLFKNRFVLLTGKEKLNDCQRSKLPNLLALNSELKTIYEAKENLRDIYQIKNTNIAYPELRSWIIYSKASKITELIKVSETYSEWFTLIFNYWYCPITNGFTEGKINKIKVLQRKAYQFRHFYSLRYHVLLEDWKS